MPRNAKKAELAMGVPEWLLLGWRVGLKPIRSAPNGLRGDRRLRFARVGGCVHGSREFSKLRSIVKSLRLCAVLGLFLPSLAWGQALLSSVASLPEAPLPQQPSSSSNVSPPPVVQREKSKPGSTLPPCPAAPLKAPLPLAGASASTANAPTAKAAGSAPPSPAVGVSSSSAAPSNAIGNSLLAVRPALCEPASKNPFQRFLSTSAPDPLTAKQKLIQSGKDVIDPFNLITIGGNSAIYVAQNARSDYGPGMLGFAKNAGVSLTQGMTGEFIGTFLLPSIMHQDPRYHRMPHARLTARIGHVIVQTLITQGDNGRPMFNYSNFPGFLIEDEISNLYVPMRHTNLASTTARVTIGLATVPIGNAITEFLPDVARHINFNVVFLQRIVNQVSGRDGTMNNE